MAPALLTAVDCNSHVHLVVGSNTLAAARCTRSLEVRAKVKLIAPEEGNLPQSITKSIRAGRVEWLKREFLDDDLTSLGREEANHVVDAVFLTEGGSRALSTAEQSQREAKLTVHTDVHISAICRRLRIPVNVVDAPDLCTFTLLSTYTDGPLQIGVTTSGNGCKLASRIRREVASSLPTDMGEAVTRLGSLRQRLREHADPTNTDGHLYAEDEDTGQSATFNSLVTENDNEAKKNRRIRWLSQICEYWPLSRLASFTTADLESALQCYKDSEPVDQDSDSDEDDSGGEIALVGCGPGSPDLLTSAAHRAITSAELVLADKLVPAAILALVPRRVTVHIARKFPGNADAAQEELLEMGLDGLRAGKRVVRLKQGDPYLYGRGKEEYYFFKEAGYTPIVIPGITSALSAPLLAGIPVTTRLLTDRVLICTGTGHKGAAPDPPPYVGSQTVVFLMALHRLRSLVASLVTDEAGWPVQTACAVIERASCPDQRVIRSTLEHICAAVDDVGSRPPGLLVVGSGCGARRTSYLWQVEEGFKGFRTAREDDYDY